MELDEALFLLLSICLLLMSSLALFSYDNNKQDKNITYFNFEEPKVYSCEGKVCDVPNTSLKCKNSIALKDGTYLCNLDDLE